MDLSDSIAAIGGALAAGRSPAPAAELFHDRDVFTAEFGKIFLRPWMAVDHHSRLPAGSGYFLFDAAIRRLILSRDGDGRLHALRNACLHAGYPVCEDEEPEAAELFCPYHGWQYALDGRLLEPRLHPEQNSLPRYRLQNYPVRLVAGLLLVDLSGEAADAPPGASLPAWLAGGRVALRRRFDTAWNWKYLRHYLWSSPELFLADPAIAVEFGPLSLLVANERAAILLRLVPRSPQHSDFELVRIVEAPGTEADDEALAGRIAEGLSAAAKEIGAAPLGFLDRGFFLWYAGLMA